MDRSVSRTDGRIVLMAADPTKNWWLFPGFDIELVASGLDLPVNLAFVPKPGNGPKAPLLYVTELYGQVKVLSNDWTLHTYADHLLNFKPDHKFPGTGECGLIGICVEPASGDLFLSMIYEEDGSMKSKVVRTSSESGLTMDKMTTVIDDIPSVHAAHQVQAVTVGPDRKLYVSLGDGMIDPRVAQDDNDLRGKVLRMNLDGSTPPDNPHPGSLVFAKGFRNPFGAAWRRSNRALYLSDNGPQYGDRIIKVESGKNYGWPDDLERNALFWWDYTHAPTAIAFMQDGQFPAEYDDELFVALFGSAYFKGRTMKGKKIVKIRIAPDDSGVVSCDDFVIYVGAGPASPLGLAFGPGGLYFSDLHGEADGLKRSPAGNILRIRPRE